jgi:hypothetical protein
MRLPSARRPTSSYCLPDLNACGPTAIDQCRGKRETQDRVRHARGKIAADDDTRQRAGEQGAEQMPIDRTQHPEADAGDKVNGIVAAFASGRNGRGPENSRNGRILCRFEAAGARSLVDQTLPQWLSKTFKGKNPLGTSPGRARTGITPERL